MDLGIKGKRALVCASSKGLGRGCAEALAEAREELADRRDDASAHGHRMASLTSQLEAAEALLEAAYGYLVTARGDWPRVIESGLRAVTLAEQEGDVAARQMPRGSTTVQEPVSSFRAIAYTTRGAPAADQHGLGASFGGGQQGQSCQ